MTTEEAMLDLGIVVVTLNHKPFIGPCVESALNSQTSCSFELIVVDDGSVDGSREVLETYADRLTLIKQNGGHSFSENNNRALRSVEAKYYVLLNPDTMMPENALEDLYNFMEANPQVGACGPKLVFPNGEIQYSCRRFPNPVTVILRRTPVRYLLPRDARGKKHLMTDWTHDQISEVDWLLAACIIFRAEALKQAGYLDERFRLYCEDIDICYRLWQNDWAVYYNPCTVIVHDHQAKSDGVLLSRHSLWHYQSMFRYFLKHGFAGFRRPLPARASRSGKTLPLPIRSW
jgi:GT2 family glycosyltransferase